MFSVGFERNERERTRVRLLFSLPTSDRLRVREQRVEEKDEVPRSAVHELIPCKDLRLRDVSASDVWSTASLTLRRNHSRTATVDPRGLTQIGLPPVEPSFANCTNTGNPESVTHGVVWELTIHAFDQICLQEGLGDWYTEESVEAHRYEEDGGGRVHATMVNSVSWRTVKRMIPASARYMQLIWDGADEAKLDPGYVKELKSIPCCKPPDVYSKALFMSLIHFHQYVCRETKEMKKTYPNAGAAIYKTWQQYINMMQFFGLKTVGWDDENIAGLLAVSRLPSEVRDNPNRKRNETH